jgi:hypothetical protein
VTFSNSSELPAGLSFECLYKKALYVPLPKPGQHNSKSCFENGSAILPDRIAVKMDAYTLYLIFVFLLEITAQITGAI